MLGHDSIGKPEIRIDAIDKVTGQAQYANDLRFPGLLYAKVKRSITGHANILNIDTSKAGRAPGVKAIVTGKEFSEKFSYPQSGNPLQDQPFLAFGRIRFAGVSACLYRREEECSGEVDGYQYRNHAISGFVPARGLFIGKEEIDGCRPGEKIG